MVNAIVDTTGALYAAGQRVHKSSARLQRRNADTKARRFLARRASRSKLAGEEGGFRAALFLFSGPSGLPLRIWSAGWRRGSGLNSPDKRGNSFLISLQRLRIDLWFRIVNLVSTWL
jgi:hypothetical protein